MFYLLENNRIIEWNGDCIIKDIPKNINGVYKMKKIIIFKSETIKDGFVKKQSENVFDLIEMGDLIKDDNRVYEVREIDDGKDYDGRKSAISQPAMFRHWEWKIEAIYKPDDKGNYIKVWERKE